MYEGNQDDDSEAIQSESSHQSFPLSSALLGLVCEHKIKVGTQIFLLLVFTAWVWLLVSVNMCRCVRYCSLVS